MDMYILLICFCILLTGLFWWASFKPPVIKELLFVKEELDFIEIASGKKAAYLRRTFPIKDVINIAIAIGLAIFFIFIFNNIIAAILAFGFYLIYSYQKKILHKKKIDEHIEKQTEVALRQMGSHFLASKDFLFALKETAKYTQPPLKDEFNQVIAEVTVAGEPLLSSLLEMAERINNKDMKTFVKAAVKSEEMGTDTAEVINMITDLIKEKNDLKEELRTEAKGQMTTINVFLAVIPISLLIILLIPTALNTLQNTKAGQFTLIFLVLVQYCSWYFARWKGEIDL